MSDLISRDEAITYIKDHFCNRCDTHNGMRCAFCDVGNAMSVLKDVPAVDAEPVRHASWKYSDDDVAYCACWWECSACGSDEPVNTAYCPSCGAKMDLEE